MKTTKKEETPLVEETTTVDAIRKMNIHQKLHAVMTEGGMVAKDKRNKHHQYDYASAASYLKTIRPLLIKYRLSVTPNVVRTGGDANNPELMGIVMSYTFVNIDNPTDLVQTSIASAGSDKGDKAVFKAMTSAQKYMFAQVFCLETGDDPEADTSVDERAEARSKAPKAPAAVPAKAGGFGSKIGF